MKNILIINGHQPYEFSKGELTQSLIDVATNTLQNKGLTVKHSSVTDYLVADELEKWQWADAVIFQFPSNWMTIPWSAKNIWTMFLPQEWAAFCACMTAEVRKTRLPITALAV